MRHSWQKWNSQSILPVGLWERDGNAVPAVSDGTNRFAVRFRPQRLLDDRPRRDSRTISLYDSTWWLRRNQLPGRCSEKVVPVASQLVERVEYHSLVGPRVRAASDL